MTIAPEPTTESSAVSATGTKRGTVIAAMAGILYPVLSVARVPLTGEAGLPTWEAASTEIVDFYGGLDFDTTFLIGFAMVATGWLMYLVFIAKFASIVGYADGGSPWMGSLIVSLAVISVGMAFLYLIAIATSARWAGAGMEASALLGLHGVATGVIWFALLTDALLSAVLAVVILATRAFPRWIGVGMIGTAVLDVFAFFGPVDVWNAVGGLPYLWTLILAVTMLIRAGQYSNSKALESRVVPV